MPEGDTVFLSAHRLHEALAGQKLLRAELRHPRLSTVDLAGSEVHSVVSIGKHMFVRLGEGRSLHTHFRMDGSWRLYSPGQRWHGPGHQIRAILATADRAAVGFRLHDLQLLPTTQEGRIVGHLGPDLLDPRWTDEHETEAVRRLVSRPDRPVGLALLDQTVMAGIGNVYRNEICFVLGVSPWTAVSEVDTKRTVSLCRKFLLRNAWHMVRSTTDSLARGERYWVYERANRGCRRCGNRVRSGVLGEDLQERTVWYCPTCQPGSPGK